MNTDKIRKRFEENLQLLDENYVVVADYHVGIGGEKTILKDSQQYRCRFCGKRKTKADFKKVAHVLSRCIGNNSLFSEFECDECNEKVFGPLESNFSEYMKLYHTFARIRGYKGVPSYKPNCRENTRVDYKDEKIHIKSYENESPIVDVDEKAKTVRVHGRRSYVPVLVYKALVKMALSVLPEKEMENMQATLSWLQGEQLRNDFYVKYKMYGGYNRFGDVTIVVCKRKDGCTKNVPAYIFELAYGYFTFSSFIPFCALDKDLMGKKVELIPIVCPFDATTRPVQEKWLNLSSEEKVSNEEISLSLSYGELQKSDDGLDKCLSEQSV